ncbi:MAG: AAA family ATPase, partial [Planctomycetes bacterium]|nr:AAA family ATPase [Planctomycetota bacterium]
MVPLSRWEDIYRAASPAQQRELLALARSQGLLYFHQLPLATNGSKTPEATRPLSALLTSPVEDLEPIRPGALEFFDQALDGVQREAVAKALFTPDLCLLQGLPGTGKSRVAAEMVTQAALRGERVLLLASSPPAIDRVLEQVAGRDMICPVRCLGPDESLETLTPTARAYTFAERVRHLREHPLQCARREMTVVDQRCAQRRQEEPVLAQLQELAEQEQRLEAQREEVRQQTARVPAEVEREAREQETAEGPAELDSFPVTMRAWARTRQETLTRLDSAAAENRRKLDEQHREEADLTRQLETLRPLQAAKESKHWWTRAWWRATLKGDLAAEVSRLETRHHQVVEDLEKLEEESRRLTQERAEVEKMLAEERASRVQAEVARRQALQDQAAAALQHDQQLLQEKWQVLCRQLTPDSPRPAARTPEAVQAAREAGQRLLEQDLDQLAFARQVITCLEQEGATVAERLPGYVNLVAATTAGLPGDEHFGDAAASLIHFDLLVLEEADRVTEAEFLTLARRARRWVLIGEPPWELEHGPEAVETSPAPHAPERTPRKARAPGPAHPAVPALRPTFFHRLWQHLHCDPSRLPYAWIREKDRLRCRLRPVPPEQQQWVESERVADSPEIELHILALPRTYPALVEVVFPAGLSIVQAKEYIYRELEEVALQTSSRSWSWVEEPDHLELCLAEVPAGQLVPVDLEPGVREWVVDLPSGT